MIWPAWLSLASPLKLSLWIANRLATNTGVLYLWKRVRSRRTFWIGLVLINAVSIGGMALLLLWLRRRVAQ